MKKLLLFASVAFSISASAQFTVWEDDFNDGNISDWTVRDLNTDGQSWQANKELQVNEAGAPDIIIGERAVLGVYNIDMTNGAPLGNGQGYPFGHEWAISPAIDLSLYSGTTQLVFNAQKAIYDGPDNIFIYISTSPEIESFDEIATIYLERISMTDPEFADHTVDISDYVGEEQVYFAFVTINNFFVGYEVDNVRITAAEIAGTDNYSKIATKIRQNPVAETLQLQFGNTGLTEGTDLKIYNVNGMLVQENVYSEAGVSVSGLASGMYFVTVDNGAAVERLKFIKK